MSESEKERIVKQDQRGEMEVSAVVKLWILAALVLAAILL